MFRVLRQRVWWVWFFSSFFYAYQYILRVLPNLIMNDVIQKFHIDVSIFGQFSGFYYIGYACMHIPVGIMLDCIGPRVVVPICALLTVIGFLPLIYTEIWIYPVLGRALIGVGSSGAILGVFKIIRAFFPEERFTQILGLSVTIGLLGAIYGGEPVHYLLGLFGWEKTLNCIALLGVAVAIILFCIIPQDNAHYVEDTNIIHSIKAVCGNHKVLAVCCLGGLMVGPLEGFADVWGTEFLKVVYGFDDDVAASLPSLIFFGMCFGAPGLSYIADKSGRYFNTIIASGVIMGLCFLAILYCQLPLYILIVFLFIIGFFCAYQISVIYKASTYASASDVGLTAACANMIIMSFGYVFHSMIGQIMSMLWDGGTVNGVNIYDARAFSGSLLIIPVGLFLGALGFAYFKHATPEAD